MVQIIHLLLCFMISFGDARENPLLHEDGNPESHQESRQLAAPEVLGNLRTDESIPFAPGPVDIVPPYIDPKCCNFSTTNLCSRMGTEGYKGYCMPRNETCYGKEYEGSWYCAISNHQACKCCVPTDCSQQTLSPCAKLNGTCMGINDECIGESVTGNEFCKQDTKNETCKCCYKPDCPCGQDYTGVCYSAPSIPGGKRQRGDAKVAIHKNPGVAIPILKRQWGRCMKSCDAASPLLLSDSTCNKTGGKDCKCCAGCYVSKCPSTTAVYSCMCMVNGQQCRKGYCTNPDDVTCPKGSCSCCEYKPPGCYSISGQCDAPKDYCVRKSENVCPKGFAKVDNACDRKKRISKVYPSRIASVCDCCKSTACSSIDNRCTEPGSYCIDQQETCPDGYEESLDCSRPIISKGIWIDSILCKCCKPKPIECPYGCFRVGSQCFINPKNMKPTSSWIEANATCDNWKNALAEPDCPQALSQYLANISNNTNDANFWIGAHGTSAGSAIWVTGGVIGPNAPWFANSYETCDNPNCCVDLQVNPACTGSNQCLGDSTCKGGISRKPLCACKNPFKKTYAQIKNE